MALKRSRAFNNLSELEVDRKSDDEISRTHLGFSCFEESVNIRQALVEQSMKRYFSFDDASLIAHKTSSPTTSSDATTTAPFVTTLSPSCSLNRLSINSDDLLVKRRRNSIQGGSSSIVA
jgi:hypothetical protein